jgi:hypothetical protein
MNLRSRARYMLITSCLGIWGCIGTTEAGSADSTLPKGPVAQSQEPRGPRVRRGATPCEPPVVTTGDLTTPGTAPCGGTEFENEELTLEPPEVHPN